MTMTWQTHTRPRSRHRAPLGGCFISPLCGVTELFESSKLSSIRRQFREFDIAVPPSAPTDIHAPDDPFPLEFACVGLKQGGPRTATSRACKPRQASGDSALRV